MKTYNCPHLLTHPLYKEITTELSSKIKRGQPLIPSPTRLFYLLMLMKYLIETNGLIYQDIINDDVDELFDLLHKECDDFTIFSIYLKRVREYKLYKLLKHVAFDDYAIHNYDNIVLDNYIDPNKKYLFVANGDIPYLPYKNVDVFDDTFRSKKLNKYTPKCFEYFVYDKILDIDRKFYISSSDINKEYDGIIFINRDTKFVDCHQYLLSKHIRNFNVPIFAIYQYRQISKFRSAGYRLHDLNRIIINNNTANLIFEHKDEDFNKTISERMVNIKDISTVPFNKISEILFNNDVIPGVSKNITLEDFENHNYRVGLSTYENNDEHNIILQLIDKNEDITNRIHKLDEEISYKIDELIVR